MAWGVGQLQSHIQVAARVTILLMRLMERAGGLAGVENEGQMRVVLDGAP